MISPPIKPASRPGRPRSASLAGRPTSPRPCPHPGRARAAPTALVSILPPALQALLEALPPEAHLPLEVLAPLVVERTPLANATLSLWAYLLKPAVLDAIFERHRGRSFEDTLHFDTFVELIRDALVLHNGSGRQSFQRAERAGRPADLQGGRLRQAATDPHLAEHGLLRGGQRADHGRCCRRGTPSPRPPRRWPG